MTRMYFIMMSVVAVSVLGTQPVQADSNFYLGRELGANFATSLDTIGSDTDRASVCDEFINPGFASVAGCTDPGRGMGDEWTNRFDNTEGLLAGVTVGYRWRGRFRLEAEYSYRDSPYDQTSPLTDASGATLAKLGGELERAEERIGSVSAHNLFGNVYYDLVNASRFTPYIGFGVGVGFTDVDYGGVFARAGDPRVITTGAGPSQHRCDSPESGRDDHQRTDQAGGHLVWLSSPLRRGLRADGRGRLGHQGTLDQLRSF